jgi:hypothetical protein
VNRIRLLPLIGYLLALAWVAFVVAAVVEVAVG